MAGLNREFPEYLELNRILKLSEITWRRFGLSAGDLSELDGWTLELIQAALAE